MSSIASSATSVLIAHVAAHTSTIRLGAGGVMLPNHCAADHRRAVRHAGDAAPGPDRPRPGPRAGQRPEHHAGAAPRSDERRHASRRTCWNCRATSPDRPGSRAWRRPRARAPTCRCTSWAPRCSAPSWPPQLGLPYAFASHFAPERAAGRRGRLPPRIPALRAARRPARDRRRQRHRRGSATPTRRRVPGHQARPGSRCSSAAAAKFTRRRGGHDPGLAAGPAHGADDEVLRRRHARRRDWSTWTRFAEHADADELIVAYQAPTVAQRLRALELTAQAGGLAA